MAFYNEEYSKACRLWIDNNGEFYRHFTDAVKQLRLSGMLHVYDFALTNLQGRPQSIKVGDYGELVWDKYEKIHSDFGGRSLKSKMSSTLLQRSSSGFNCAFSPSYWQKNK